MGISIVILVVFLLFIALLILLLVRFKMGKQKSETEWKKSAFNKIGDLGATGSLEVIPLVDWYSGQEGLAVELELYLAADVIGTALPKA